MLISYTMGILISTSCKNKEFKNLVLTFESEPKFVEIKGTTLLEQVQSISKAPWGGTTNLIKAFDVLLLKAKRDKLSPDKMPKKLLVISDMQFNQAQHEGIYNTNYEVIRQKYSESNYNIPHIIFWNVNGYKMDFQASSNTKGVSMISGFSVETLKAVLKGDEITPYTTMLNAILDERYECITL